MKPQTFALDVYGTLIDTSGVVHYLETILGAQAKTFSDLWRSKQLEYSFRRGLMDKYVDFSICTREAMEYTIEALAVDLSATQRQELMDQYKTLPAFPEVPESLTALKEAGHFIYAYSNGSRKAVSTLFDHAGVLNLFDGIVSMEDVGTFKPNPKGYRHFNQATNSQPATSWLVSGNPFDVIGAAAYGMNTVWLKWDPAKVLDPMGYTPVLIIPGLSELKSEMDLYLDKT